MAERALTRAELQMWLNDHVSEELTVSVMVTDVVTDASASILSGRRVLRRWSQDPSELASKGEPCADISGLYAVGEWSLDVNGLDQSYAGRRIALGEGAEQIEILPAVRGQTSSPVASR